MSVKIQIEKLIVSCKATIKDTLNQLDVNGISACFVVDDKDKQMVAIVTDGDLRRAILKGIKLEENILSISNKNFVYCKLNDTPEKINQLLNETIKIIPLVNEKMIPMDYATKYRHRYLPIYETEFIGNELQYIIDCVQSGWISSQGKYVTAFEQRFAEYIGVPFALTTSNGTVALHLSLVTLGIGEGDEVLVPNFTFAASINSILYTGAKPVLVDIDLKSFNIDTKVIESKITNKTKAIMVVHIYGNPCEMETVHQLAQKYNLHIIEDAAESFGSKYKNSFTGSLGDIGCFSFFGNKTLTTGEGGMITFKDKKLFEKAKILRDHGMLPGKRYWHEFVGFNYRMTNLQAAIGLGQIERANDVIEKKIKLAKSYKKYLANIPGIYFVINENDIVNTYWLFTILIEPEFGITKEDLQKKLTQFGIETRNLFYPINVMTPYKNLFPEESYNNSEYVSKNGLSLPSSTLITESEVIYITDIIKNAYLNKFTNIKDS